MTFWYRLCWWICRIGLFFWHPVFHVVGRELVPVGKAVICANHSGCADAIWLLLALDAPQMSRIIAKKELRKVPVVSRGRTGAQRRRADDGLRRGHALQ